MAGQLYATQCDRLWARTTSRALAVTHRLTGSPWIAMLAMGGGGITACLFDPHVLVLILGNGNVVTYAGLCLAALKARGGSKPLGWQMPGLPAAPNLGLVCLSAVAVFDAFDPAGRAGLAITVLTMAAALAVFGRSGVPTPMSE